MPVLAWTLKDLPFDEILFRKTAVKKSILSIGYNLPFGSIVPLNPSELELV